MKLMLEFELGDCEPCTASDIHVQLAGVIMLNSALCCLTLMKKLGYGRISVNLPDDTRLVYVAIKGET